MEEHKVSCQRGNYQGGNGMVLKPAGLSKTRLAIQ